MAPKTLQVGRLDEHQVEGEPIFPTPPAILRTGPDAFFEPFPSVLAARLIADGAAAGQCDADDLTGCGDLQGATVVFVREHEPGRGV